MVYNERITFKKEEREMRKFMNFMIAVILGTAVAAGVVCIMDNMITIPYGKEYLAYVMLGVAVSIGVAFATTLNNRMK